MQFRRSACKKPAAKARFQRILELCAAQYYTSAGACRTPGEEGHKTTEPDWYHDIATGQRKPPTTFPAPQNRKGDAISIPQHDHGHDPNGPVGLLITSIIWHGLKINSDLGIWQVNEEPIDFLQTPYQTLQPQLIQIVARARTCAGWNIAKPRVRGLREIGREATKMHCEHTP